MAKKPATVEVKLQNDWYDGASLLRPSNNPHFLTEAKLEILPGSAKIKVGDEWVSVTKLRDDALAAQAAEASEKLAASESKTEKNLKL